MASEYSAAGQRPRRADDPATGRLSGVHPGTSAAGSAAGLRRERIRQLAQEARMSASALRLLDHLFERPVVNVKAAADELEISYVRANALIRELCEIGVLSETTGGSRNRIFRFGPYLDLFADVNVGQAEIAETQPTRS